MTLSNIFWAGSPEEIKAVLNSIFVHLFWFFPHVHKDLIYVVSKVIFAQKTSSASHQFKGINGKKGFLLNLVILCFLINLRVSIS